MSRHKRNNSTHLCCISDKSNLVEGSSRLPLSRNSMCMWRQEQVVVLVESTCILHVGDAGDATRGCCVDQGADTAYAAQDQTLSTCDRLAGDMDDMIQHHIHANQVLQGYIIRYSMYSIKQSSTLTAVSQVLLALSALRVCFLWLWWWIPVQFFEHLSRVASHDGVWRHMFGHHAACPNDCMLANSNTR